MICIIGAIYKEVSLLLASLGHNHQVKLQGKQVFLNKKAEQEILIALTDIGAINAAQMTTLLLERYPIKIVILIGCGGTFSEAGLRLGDIALATKEIWAQAQIYRCFSVDTRLIKAFSQYMSSILPPHIIFKAGPFISVLATTNTKDRLTVLKERYPETICENMEGAAVAQVCKIYETPFLETRGISNFLGEYDKSKWKIDLATNNVQKVIINLLERGTQWLP
jgi:futalosine hydrolase